MRILGLDLGSRRTKAVLLEDRNIATTAIFESWLLSKDDILQWVRTVSYDSCVCTGYSRRLAAENLGGKIITEISAFASGAAILAPESETIIDIGGQDAKVIKREKNGSVADFEMNDRCAAGTGKFFEISAKTLGKSYDEFIEAAFSSEELQTITSICAVFAESEIIGKLAEGISGNSIARGIFHSVAQRILTMIKRLSGKPPFILVGGGANRALSRELEKLLGEKVDLPPNASYFGAAGAALSGLKKHK
ncbi:MAG: 3-hydroxyacyl-ACP dehydratase [Candidatus Riflebacteria bacterium]|nr:3-hydroxyacyl-ACP dehydratase [Candidatus Riflebacteria bacterium]